MGLYIVSIVALSLPARSAVRHALSGSAIHRLPGLGAAAGSVRAVAEEQEKEETALTGGKPDTTESLAGGERSQLPLCCCGYRTTEQGS